MSSEWSGNKLTLDELAQIEASAERSKTPEAETILRLAAALRESMQVSEGALAFMTRAKKLDKRIVSHLRARLSSRPSEKRTPSLTQQ